MTRVLGFLVGCIGTRLLLVLLAATVSPVWLKAMAVVAAAIALGFTVIYAGGLRRTGPETDGKPIWWDSLRPIHALLYAAFAYFAWTGRRREAWAALLLDVVIGLAAFLGHHGSSLWV